MPTPDERNIERLDLTVTGVEQVETGSKDVRVTAMGGLALDREPATTLLYVTTADRAPRVGIKLQLTVEAVR